MGNRLHTQKDQRKEGKAYEAQRRKGKGSALLETTLFFSERPSIIYSKPFSTLIA